MIVAEAPRHRRALASLSNDSQQPGVHILSKRTLFTAILAATLAACHDSPTAPDTGGSDLQLGLQLVVDGLANPDFLTAPVGDARLFVVERSGRVLIVKNGALLATPFLDIRARVNSIEERGLLSIAFDPQYAANGYFYAYYVNLGGDMAVERFSSTPGSDVAGGSADMVMTIPHGGANHHGGLITFGLDGMLYVAPGDGGCCNDPQNNAQNLGTLLGKILRIPSTLNRERSTSATLDRIRERRSMSLRRPPPAATMVGASWRARRASIQRRIATPEERSRGPCSSICTLKGARSSAATCIAARRFLSSRAITSTPTIAKAGCAASAQLPAARRIGERGPASARRPRSRSARTPLANCT